MFGQYGKDRVFPSSADHHMDAPGGEPGRGRLPGDAGAVRDRIRRNLRKGTGEQRPEAGGASGGAERYDLLHHLRGVGNPRSDDCCSVICFPPVEAVFYRDQCAGSSGEPDSDGNLCPHFPSGGAEYRRRIQDKR